MPPDTLPSLATLSSAFALALPVLLSTPASAASKPYEPDAATLHLYHFDEVPGNIIAPNLGNAGGQAITVVEQRTTANGNASEATASPNVFVANAAPGFGSAALLGRSVFAKNPANNQMLGFDASGDGAYTQHTSDAKRLARDYYQLGLPSLAGPDGSFTLEAMISLESTDSVVEGKEIARCIIATESSVEAHRGWTFRISNGAIQFAGIVSTAGTYPPFLNVRIPLTGPHSFAPGHWFHVAYTYDAAKGLVRVYWTRVDSDAQVANLLYESEADTLIKPAAITPHLTFGGDGRGTITESLGGLLDEVRISSIARTPADFIFQSADIGLTAGRDGRDIILGWTSPTGIASLINVYRHTTSSKEGRVHIAALHAESSTFADRTPTASATYWYWVSYTNSAGKPVDHGPYAAPAASIWKP